MKYIFILFLILGISIPVNAQSFVNTDSMRFGGGSGAAADLTPVFDFTPEANAAGGSGLENLAAMVDPWAMTPSIYCDYKDANATNLPCTVGGTFTENQGDVNPGYPAPATSPVARSGNFDRFRSHQAPSATVGEVTTNDFRMTAIFRVSRNAGVQQDVAGKHDATATQGYKIGVTSAHVVAAQVNGTVLSGLTVGLDPRGYWYMAQLACGQTTCRFFLNGVEQANAARPANLDTVTNDRSFTIGCRSSGANADCIDGNVWLVKVDTCAGACIVDAEIANYFLEEAMRIEGTWPNVAVQPIPIERERASARSCAIKRDSDGQVPATIWEFVLTDNWLCLGNAEEASLDNVAIRNGRRFVTLTSERGPPHLLLQSNEFATSPWTLITNGTITQPFVSSDDSFARTPSVANTEFWRFVSNSTANAVYGLRQPITLTADKRYIFSCKFGYRSGEATRYVALRDNTGTNAHAFFDLLNCHKGAVGAGLMNMGTNVNEGTDKAARITDWGQPGGPSDFKWCRPEIVIDAGGSTISHDLDVIFTDTANTFAMTPAASSTRLGAPMDCQLEETETELQAGERASPYISTYATTVTPAPDKLRFDEDNIPAGGGMMVVSVLYGDSGLSNSAADYATARNISSAPCFLERNADNYINVEQTGESDTVNYGIGYSILTDAVQQWTFPGQVYPNGQYAIRDGRHHWWKITWAPTFASWFMDGYPTTVREHTGTFDLPDFEASSTLVGGAGVSLTYTSSFGAHFMRGSGGGASGGLHSCKIYAADWNVPAPR